MDDIVSAAKQQPAALSESAREFISESKAPSTIRAYRRALDEFTAYCQRRNLSPLPAQPATVANWLSALARKGAKLNSIGVKRAGIAFAHKAAGFPDPTGSPEVQATWAGIARKYGYHPRKKAPLTMASLRELLAKIPRDTRGLRDKAIILVGFFGAFRRSELVALDVDDLTFSEDALHIAIKRSKTDQEGHGATKTLPMLTDKSICPYRALRTWLDATGIGSSRGAVFCPVGKDNRIQKTRLTAQSVALIIKKYARRAGLDWRKFSGHSVRSGFITEASLAGVPNRDIMAQSGHQSEKVLRGYIQDSGAGAKRAALAVAGEKPARRQED